MKLVLFVIISVFIKEFSTQLFLLSSVSGEAEKCNEEISSASKEETDKYHAKYGSITAAKKDIQNLANLLLYKSFDFLLLGTHYDNYIKNRHGFDKLYMNISNQLWTDGVDVIKYLTTRGLEMDFTQLDANLCQPEDTLELMELHSFAKGLDIQKKIAQTTMNFHKKYSAPHSKNYDPEVAYYLKENHIEKHSKMVRDLSGYVEDLRNIFFEGPDAGLGRYLYNDYLEKR